MFIFIAFGLLTFGHADPTPPREALAQATVGTNTATTPDAALSPECEALMQAHADIAPDVVQSLAQLTRKRRLEDKRDVYVQDRYGLQTLSEMTDSRNFEKALSLLARGETTELLAYLRPIYRQVVDNGWTIKQTVEAMAAEKAKPQFDTKTYDALDLEYRTASIPFGENYGRYMNMMTLLQSVAKGEGVAGHALIPFAEDEEKDHVVLYDLSAKISREAATRILGILNPAVELNWLPNSQVHPQLLPNEQLRILFNHNIYALIAKLERDLQAERADQSVWRRTIRWVSMGYMSGSQKLLGEPWRSFLLTATGIAVDNFMLELYLDKVEAVVNVTRRRDSTGRVVISSHKLLLDQATRLMQEFDSQAIGDDFLKTMAKIGYRTEQWNAILMAVRERARLPAGSLPVVPVPPPVVVVPPVISPPVIKPATSAPVIAAEGQVTPAAPAVKPAALPTTLPGLDENSPFFVLYQRMLKAQVSRVSEGGLPEMYEPMVAYKIIFAVVQVLEYGSLAEFVNYKTNVFPIVNQMLHLSQ